MTVCVQVRTGGMTLGNDVNDQLPKQEPVSKSLRHGKWRLDSREGSMIDCGIKPYFALAVTGYS